MTTFTYPVYGKAGSVFSITIPKEIEESDYYKILESIGYEKKIIGKPYYYTYDSVPLIEIIIFDKGDSSIVGLWDYNGSLQEFYCKNAHDKLDLLMKYTSMMKNIVSAEYMNARMHKGMQWDAI